MTTRQALIIASAIVLAGVAHGIAASVRGPDSLPGCIYNASPPTLSDGQSAVLTCDSTGKLRVTTTF